MRRYTVAQSNAFRGLIPENIVYDLNKYGYGYFTCTFWIPALQINTIHHPPSSPLPSCAALTLAMEPAVPALLVGLGKDDHREGLHPTPKHIAKAFRDGNQGMADARLPLPLPPPLTSWIR